MPERWYMLGVLFLVRLAMGYQFQSVASVSSHLVDQLGFTYAEVGTLIGLFLLPGIFIAIPSGLLTRAVSDRRLLMAGAITMIAGAAIMAAAEAPRMLYVGRLVAGVGGTLFNVILTKMVTDWFDGKEIVTALAVMLTAWPIGISLGLLSQGSIADAYGWSWTFVATGILAALSLFLTWTFYRDAVTPVSAGGRIRFSIPLRQFVHVSVVSVAWALFNVSLIVLVSFAPDVLVAAGYSPARARTTVSLAMWATLVSIPLGGRLLEVFGWITTAIAATLCASSLLMIGLAHAVAPEILCVALGLLVGIPAGALVALTSEALTPENRGPGLGIHYTGYYIGMAVGPAFAGWTRDASANVAAPLFLGAAMLILVVACVLVLRLLQRTWPVGSGAPADRRA